MTSEPVVNDRLLFVDDDPGVRRAFARSMRRRGFVVDVADNGDEAFELASRFPYAVIATDLRMPGLDGLRLIERLRALQPDTVCMLVTGSHPDTYERQATEARVLVITKPWDGDRLADALLQAVEQHRARRAQKLAEAPAPITGPEMELLLVEDDDTHAELVRSMLAEAARDTYKVTRVRTLDEAEKLLATRSFDACLTDLTLPDARGIEAVSRLLRAAPALPTVVLTARSEEALGLQAVQAGAQDFLEKEEASPTAVHRAIRYARERKKSEERLTYLSHHDELTGLGNRTALRERLELTITRARLLNRKVAVLFLDLDRFKAINESLGPTAGDTLLRQVAHRLPGCVRPSDFVARLGGDEYAILLDDLGSTDEPAAAAQRVLNSFATPFSVAEHELVASTSVGIALFPDNGADVDALLKAADAALYRAKEAGRNAFQFFGNELHEKAVRKLQLESDLRRALEEEQFVLFYQPQVSLQTRRMTGVEALLRWNRPGGGLVSPAEFIPLLEETGLIVEAGEWILRRACTDMAKLHADGFDQLVVAVNVSPRQFQDPGLPSAVERALTETGLPASALELELTESMLVAESEVVRGAFQAIERLGVRVAIDDFGTGYSTLTALKRFPVRALKIDRSFVADVTVKADDAAIATAVIALAHSLGLEVVAEGVEREEHVLFLRKHGCDTMQGYHISRPIPLAQLEEFARRWNAANPGPIESRVA